MRPGPAILGAALGLGLTVGLAGAESSPVVSPVIFPRYEPTIHFAHDKHAAVPCLSCHGSVRQSVAVKDRHLPPEGTCARCHPGTRGALTTRQGAACARCHRGYSGGGVPHKNHYPEANLRFGHRLHLERGVPCASCHRFRPGERPLPAMATCRGCHQRRGASVRCAGCHLTAKDGRLLTRFASGVLRPGGNLLAGRHTSGFSRKHAALARADRETCDRCHQPSSCLRCHAGSLRPLTIHPGDYATLHALDARRNATRCRSCHRSQSFCLSCHQRLGMGQETPRGAFRPGGPQALHPPGWSGMPAGPGHHSLSARRNINTCSSCHREDTCRRCHATRSIGRGGITPHPPGFSRSAKCRALSQRNGRVCLKCHLRGDRRTGCE